MTNPVHPAATGGTVSATSTGGNVTLVGLGALTVGTVSGGNVSLTATGNLTATGRFDDGGDVVSDSQRRGEEQHQRDRELDGRGHGVRGWGREPDEYQRDYFGRRDSLLNVREYQCGERDRNERGDNRRFDSGEH